MKIYLYSSFIACISLLSINANAQNKLPASGNVGIGTTDPLALLHIAQNDGAGDVVRAPILLSRYWSSSTETRAAALFSYYNNSVLNDQLVFAVAGTGGSASSPLSYSQAKMVIQANGNVGIGTTAPQASLSLGATNGKRMLVYDGGSTGVQAGFGIDMSGTSRELTLFHSTSDGTNGDISFGKRLENTGNYTEMMRILGNGNVAIGTADPKGYRLAVNGAAIFTRVVVKLNTNWPDYVFHPTYRLRPLSEVEQYIQQNHHLPEVPSAEEVKKDGLDVEDVQAIMLKKVEELTLYLIDQNKKMEVQGQKLLELEQRIKALQNENEKLQKPKGL